MKKYSIIDTRRFDIHKVSIVLNDGHYTLLEDQQYLESCDQKIWKQKFPFILQDIAKTITDTIPIFIFPEATSINLIVEAKHIDNFTLEQQLAQALQQDFGICSQHFAYRYLKLQNQCYFITLIPKKFLHFIKSTFKNLPYPFYFLPPMVGLKAYFDHLPKKGTTTIAIFIEQYLRRFFIQNQQTFNFIDFQQNTLNQQNTLSEELKTSHQFITQTLDIPSGEKQILLFGNFPPALLNTYSNDPQFIVKNIQNIEQLSGSTERTSTLRQCLYVGICDFINEPNHPLNTFNFYNFQPIYSSSIKIFKHIYKTIERYFTPIFCTCILLFFVLMAGIIHESHQQKNLLQQLEQVYNLRSNIQDLHTDNQRLIQQNNTRLFLPNAILTLCQDLQKIECDFCIDNITIVNVKQQYYFNLKGRIEQKHFKKFAKDLNQIIKSKLPEKSSKKFSLQTTSLEGSSYEFTIKIPLRLPPFLTLKS